MQKFKICEVFVVNNKRRQAIRMIIKELKKENPDTDCIVSELQALLDDESYAMDNVPESLQDGDRYLIMEESVAALEDAIDAIDPSEPESFAEAVDILCGIDGV